MSYRNKLENLISNLENKVASRQQTDQLQYIETRLNDLLDRVKNASSDEEKHEAQIALRELSDKVSGGLFPSLAEVEEEISRIYGDQSKNETYYFSRRRKASTEDVDWRGLTLEEAEAKINAIYGNQSKNETYYFSRKSGGLASVPFKDIVAHVEDSLKEAEYYTPVEMTPLDMYAVQDSEHPAAYREAGPIHGGYSTDLGHSMNSDSTHTVVNTPMHYTDDLGFGHNVRTKVEEAPHIRADNPEWDRHASLVDGLIKLGEVHEDLQSDIKVVLDTITKTSHRVSLNSVLAKLNGQRVRKTVHNVETVEDIPEMRENIIRNLKRDYDLTDEKISEIFREDDDAFYVGNTYLHKPLYKKEEIGTFLVKSRHYHFKGDTAIHPVRGDKPKASEISDIWETGFTQSYPDGMKITFELV